MITQSENIRESEVEDALITYLDIIKEIIKPNQEIHLISRQVRLINGKKRLDILIASGDEIYLIELKTTIFQIDHLKQILAYKNEVENLQNEKKLMIGKIIPTLLVTDFSEKDFIKCQENNIKIFKYSPLVVLTRYFDNLASVAKFMKMRPVDLGVFNIGLINRVLLGIGDGLNEINSLSKYSGLSVRSINHHLKFAVELGLVIKRDTRYFLTDLGFKYISFTDTSLVNDELSPEQIDLLREYIAKDPFSSPIVFGIYTIIESMFFLARNSYPVEFRELKAFFLKVSGKTYDWKASKSLSTATYTYLNYAIKLGLLGKIGKKVVITPSGFRFILMLQLHKSIEMVETLTS